MPPSIAGNERLAADAVNSRRILIEWGFSAEHATRDAVAGSLACAQYRRGEVAICDPNELEAVRAELVTIVDRLVSGENEF